MVELQPATVSTVAIVQRKAAQAVRRSQRRVADRGT